ncbi:MAG: tautomerase family protein [Devosia indica]
MAQVKIYGERTHLRAVRSVLSDIIHASFVTAIGLPEDKRFHRFIALDAEDFIYPPGRTGAYTVIEILMFEGRSADAKATLLETLMRTISEGLAIAIDDIEITIIETPRANWGIRGQTGDKLKLSYTVG